ncbi:MAG: hypothetical protein LBR26_02690 [Prevotella sp.]|nr:hypothetical protein [Prevotella sp.]
MESFQPWLGDSVRDASMLLEVICFSAPKEKRRIKNGTREMEINDFNQGVENRQFTGRDTGKVGFCGVHIPGCIARQNAFETASGQPHKKYPVYGI